MKPMHTQYPVRFGVDARGSLKLWNLSFHFATAWPFSVSRTVLRPWDESEGIHWWFRVWVFAVAWGWA